MEYGDWYKSEIESKWEYDGVVQCIPLGIPLVDNTWECKYCSIIITIDGIRIDFDYIDQEYEYLIITDRKEVIIDSPSNICDYYGKFGGLKFKLRENDNIEVKEVDVKYGDRNLIELHIIITDGGHE